MVRHLGRWPQVMRDDPQFTVPDSGLLSNLDGIVCLLWFAFFILVPVCLILYLIKFINDLSEGAEKSKFVFSTGRRVEYQSSVIYILLNNKLVISLNIFTIVFLFGLAGLYYTMVLDPHKLFLWYLD